MTAVSGTLSLDATTLAGRYGDGTLDPTEVVEEVLARIAARGNDGVWIALAHREALLSEARRIGRRRAAGDPLPLYGFPFAVKDNIDVAGLPTTAACPAFSYTPTAHANVVARLIGAGALCIGKTNLDQFATGLVGVRSPYGTPRNPFDARYIAGGSSSGSGVSVATGLVTFALGTDTAGSGRVPAAFNNIVGLKPSRGLLSATGVVPACRSLDCVSIFALTVEDAARVAEIARGYDEQDPFSRREADAARFAPGPCPEHFRFGVPRDADLDFLGDEAAATLHADAIARLIELGGNAVEIDFAPFRRAGALLYEGPFVAERLVSAGRILADRPETLEPSVRTILESAARFDARAAFEALQRLEHYRRRASSLLDGVDFLAVPTTPTIYRIEEVQADPLKLNANLGAYVNFVNLLDLCAVAVPAGFRPNGLPAGVTLIGPRGRDAAVASFAAALHRATSRTLGATLQPLAERAGAEPSVPPGMIPLAVVGAHLSGEPLNHQLTTLGGRFIRGGHTAPAYRLYALPGTSPPKPGLVRVGGPGNGEGSRIEVEVWALPAESFGPFVARIPRPLCIGTVELDRGAPVSGFLCEGYATIGATDISSFGGWRAYLRASG